MLDIFDLETSVGREGVERISIEYSIRDKSIFKEIMSKLSNNKAPGPNGVNNELLKHLSPSMHEAIHKCIYFDVADRSNPRQLKGSNTILLHKKNS